MLTRRQNMLRKLLRDHSTLLGLARRWQSSVTVDAVHCDPERRFLGVKWADGNESKFPYVWLRDNSPDPATYNITERCRARKLLMEELNLQVQPESVHLDQDDQKLVIKWPQDVQASYSFEWLKQRDMGSQQLRQKRGNYYLEEYEAWGAEEIGKEVARPASFAKMMKDEGTLAEELQRFLRLGFLLCNEVLPNDENQVKRLGKRLGYMSNSHYGPTFTVKSFVDPSNLAFTSQALGLHTDLPQAGYPPQIQVLHCLMQAGNGGENQFVDGFRVAENLKKEQPEIYELLASTPLEYIDSGEDTFPFHMVHRWPVILADSTGLLKSIFFNNAIRSWFYDLPVEEVPKIYEAMKIFYEYCYQPRHMLQLRLQPGEMVFFANNRVLHGRSAFEAGSGGERHFEGGYINFDAAKSLVRVVLQRLHKLQHASV